MFRISVALIVLLLAPHAWAGGFNLPIYGDQSPGASMKVDTANISRTSDTLDIVITEQTGGNTCCTSLTVVTKSEEGWKTFNFVEPTSEKLVYDIDGDLNDEIVLDKIYHIKNGELVGRECEAFTMVGLENNHKRCTPDETQDLLLPDKEQSLEFKISDDELLQKYGVANDDCRGGYPNTLSMHEACAVREVYARTLELRGYCYGKFDKDDNLISREWYKCK
jgi:hypothetical protein